MNHFCEITDYIKKTTSNIIDMDKFDVAGVFEDNAEESFLVHFVATGQCKEIEFLAETEGINTPIAYYRYGDDDLIPVDDLKQYIRNETLRHE